MGCERRGSRAAEEFVDGGGNDVADAGDGAEGVGARAEVSLGAEELEGVALGLDGIGVGVGGAEDAEVDGVKLDALALAGLSTSLRERRRSFRRRGGRCRPGSWELAVGDDLELGKAGAVAQGDEAEAALAGADGADPTGDDDVGSDGDVGEGFSDGSSVHAASLDKRRKRRSGTAGRAPTGQREIRATTEGTLVRTTATVGHGPGPRDGPAERRVRHNITCPALL